MMIPQEDQNRRQEDARDHAGSEKLAPLFTERERQMLRLYNPVTGKCDLTEEEATKREACDQAVSEELERRRQERLTAWEAGVGLDKEAKQALGKFSPQSAWIFISSKVGDALELYPEESQKLAEEMGLFQPEGESAYQDLEDLREVVEQLMTFASQPASAACNYFDTPKPSICGQPLYGEPASSPVETVMCFGAPSTSEITPETSESLGGGVRCSGSNRLAADVEAACLENLTPSGATIAAIPSSGKRKAE